MTIFRQFFLIFSRIVHSRGLWFLRCVQCPKTLNLIYQKQYLEKVDQKVAYKSGPQSGGQKWTPKVDPKSGGQKRTPQVAAKSEPQKWRSKKDPKSGSQSWTPKVAAKSGPQKWHTLVADPLDVFDPKAGF